MMTGERERPYFELNEGVSHFVGIILFDKGKKAIAVGSDPLGKISAKSVVVTRDLDPKLGRVLDLGEYESVEVPGSIVAFAPTTHQRPTDSREHLFGFLNYKDSLGQIQSMQCDEPQMIGLMTGSMGGLVNLHDDNVTQTDTGDWGLLMEEPQASGQLSKSAKIYFFAQDKNFHENSALAFLEQLANTVITTWSPREIKQIHDQLITLADRQLETGLRVRIFMASVLSRYLLALDGDNESKLFIQTVSNILNPRLGFLPAARKSMQVRIKPMINAAVDRVVKDDFPESHDYVTAKAEDLSESPLIIARRLKADITDELKGNFGGPNRELNRSHEWDTMDLYLERLIMLARRCPIEEIDEFTTLFRELSRYGDSKLPYVDRSFHYETDSERRYIEKIGIKPRYKEWWIHIDDIASDIINEIWGRKQDDRLKKHGQRFERYT